MTTRPGVHMLTAATLALVALLAAPLARAESTEPAAETTTGGFAPAGDAAGAFGLTGQFALSLGATADEHFFFHKSAGEWQLQIAPALDYFLIPHVSLGGLFAYGHDSGAGGAGTSGVSSDTIRIGARAGYALAINDKFGIWPLLGLRLDYLSANHSSSTNTFLPIYVPLLFHPAPHFFAGLGPKIDLHLSGTGHAEWGFDSMLGGWF